MRKKRSSGTTPVATIGASRGAALAELSAEFDRRLASLQDPDTHDQMDAVMASRGWIGAGPKAGTSY